MFTAALAVVLGLGVALAPGPSLALTSANTLRGGLRSGVVSTIAASMADLLIAILGVIILALVSLIPFVAIITALAGMLGAGALVYRTFRRSQDRAVPAPPAPAA